MPAPGTVSEFLDVLEKSALIDAPVMQSLRQQVPSDELGSDPRRCARGLVKQGILSDFHVKQLLTGRHKGFYVGKYRVIDVLGTGGVARVFLAEQISMRRMVALKMLLNDFKSDKTMQERFRREARAAAKLRHPNIIQVFDFDEEGDATFISMEYIEGMDVNKLIKERTRLPVGMAVDLTCQAADALQHAHEQDLVHRDLKPGNMLVHYSGELKLLDLGLVMLNTPDVEALTVQAESRVMGTADYMAPEQALDSHAVDIRADIYSLGHSLYTMLAGRAAFSEMTYAQKLVAHQTKTPPPLSDFRDDVPEEVCRVLSRMTACNPEDRFQHPGQVADALNAFAKREEHPFDRSKLRFTEETLTQLLRYGPERLPMQVVVDRSQVAKLTDEQGMGSTVMKSAEARTTTTKVSKTVVDKQKVQSKQTVAEPPPSAPKKKVKKKARPQPKPAATSQQAERPPKKRRKRQQKPQSDSVVSLPIVIGVALLAVGIFCGVYYYYRHVVPVEIPDASSFNARPAQPLNTPKPASQISPMADAWKQSPALLWAGFSNETLSG